MKQPFKNWSVLIILFSAFFLMIFGCSKTAYITIKSNPPQADIYLGKSSSDLIKSKHKTPFVYSFPESKLETRCFQIIKDGYRESKIYCREKFEIASSITVELIPLNLDPGAQDTAKDIPTKMDSKRNQVTLTWDYTSSNDILGFEIERKKELDKHFKIIATIGPNERSFTDTELISGTTYSYRVRAYDSNSKSGYSEIKVKVLEDGSTIQK